MLQTPILLIIFNRPELTQRVFEEIRKAQPAKLYIAADGPRMNHPTDEKNCERCVSITSQIDWVCEVKRLNRTSNLGCGKAVSTAITWFFEQEEQGIILEDDCLPHPTFFDYCEQLLNRYKENSSIMHIGGTNFQNGIARGEGSYYFSAIPHVWGWATWRRAWKLYDFNLIDLNDFRAKHKINSYFRKRKTRQHWIRVFEQMQKHEIDTWDHQWSYSIWNNNGLTIIPQQNLISNIGFGDDATHTFGESPFANMQTQAISDLVHPKLIEQNKEADEFTFKHHHQEKRIFIHQRILRKIKRYFN